MSTNKINVNIDRIVLEGDGRIDGNQLNAAIKRELQRLVADQGLHRQVLKSTTIKSVQSKPVKLGGSRFSKDLGNQIANSVFSKVAQ